MPLPMIHLAIAVELGTHDPLYMSPAFLLGSIAPDAIHMRPDATRDDKRSTHLIKHPGGFPQDDEIQALLQGETPVFEMGYAAHILTDSLWRQTILETFKSRIPDKLDQAAHRTLYYQDTDQIDFDLYHQAAWRAEVWDKLAQAEAVDFPPLLTGAEIDGWRDRTLRWFTELKQEPGITPQYITGPMVQDFISAAAEHVGTHLRQWGVPH